MAGLRIGVIGVGRAGLMHARNLAQDGGVASITLIGRDEKRIELARTQLEAMLAPNAGVALRGEHAPDAPVAVELTTSVRSITELASELDGIVIASSTPTHPELTLEAARAGLVSLVEKPLTLKLEELETLSTELESIGTPVMVAYHRRYDPAYQRLRGHVVDGDLGVLRVLSSTNHDHLPSPLEFIVGSGGSWRDLLVHDFDALAWIADEPVVAVQAAGSVLDEPAYADTDDADTCVALLEFKSGAIATVSGIRRSDTGQDCRLEVVGSNGAFGAGLEPRMPLTSTEEGVPAPAPGYHTFIDRFEPAFRSEIRHFLRLVEGDLAANLTPPRSGLPSLQMAVAAELSRRSGSRVLIHEDSITPTTQQKASISS